jgi:hypothetical protein
MTKKKLLDEIKSNPARFYRSPGDVLRDRRFSDPERLEILRAWQDASDGPEIDGMVAELQNRFAADGHAAE